MELRFRRANVSLDQDSSRTTVGDDTLQAGFEARTCAKDDDRTDLANRVEAFVHLGSWRLNCLALVVEIIEGSFSVSGSMNSLEAHTSLLITLQDGQSRR